MHMYLDYVRGDVKRKLAGRIMDLTGWSTAKASPGRTGDKEKNGQGPAVFQDNSQAGEKVCLAVLLHFFSKLLPDPLERLKYG